MRRRSFLAILPAALATAHETQEVAGGGGEANRPRVAGTLSLRARRRERAQGNGKVRVSERVLRWEVSQTAIIVCDMWDTHTCSLSAQRVAAMAPRMNQVISAARSLGVMIVHAPSDTMKFYEGTPWRQRMQRAPSASSPTPILARCPREDAESRKFPIDDADGGCDDPVVKKWTGPYPWTRQHPAIDIVGFDGVSADAQEIYNFCRQEGITNIALMGVHTNICILNRGFGLRQLTRLGFQAVLVRDLTDAMYDPRKRPFVSHARGTELVVEHIEANWCPSILGEDLTHVIAGSDNPASLSLGSRRPV
ncbi:MAG TPA: isochorismatase family protein [Bryobacteraceae bacterium]|nr:isochorismatase family protein [Bryobacteraceae bacterium]